MKHILSAGKDLLHPGNTDLFYVLRRRRYRRKCQQQVKKINLLILREMFIFQINTFNEEMFTPSSRR
jgi:hypothetical protein